jgi:hypothetical protein
MQKVVRLKKTITLSLTLHQLQLSRLSLIKPIKRMHHLTLKKQVWRVASLLLAVEFLVKVDGSSRFGAIDPNPQQCSCGLGEARREAGLARRDDICSGAG